MCLTHIGRIRLFLLSFVCTALSCISAASGAPIKLSEQELAAVSGQGLVTLTNSIDTTQNLQFSTITLNADVALNANLKNILLGQYTTATYNGTGSDINIPLLQFGRSDGTTAQQTVQITNPYLEFVYSNAAGAGNGQVVGMRVGFNGIAGDIGTTMSSISGSLQLNDGATGILSSLGPRSASMCGSGATSCIPLSQIGGVTAGNSSGPSRDFWISMLSQPVQFAAQPGVSQPSVAQAGAWLNWTDRLTAINTTGAPPANLLALLRR